MELSNIIFKSGEDRGVRGQDQPRLYNKNLPQKCIREVIRWLMTCVWKWNSDCSHEKIQKHQDIHWKCDLVPSSTAAAWTLDKTLFTRPCLGLSLGEAATTCVAFPLWNIKSAFLYVLSSDSKSHKLKNS